MYVLILTYHGIGNTTEDRRANSVEAGTHEKHQANDEGREVELKTYRKNLEERGM